MDKGKGIGWESAPKEYQVSFKVEYGNKSIWEKQIELKKATRIGYSFREELENERLYKMDGQFCG